MSEALEWVLCGIVIIWLIIPVFMFGFFFNSVWSEHIVKSHPIVLNNKVYYCKEQKP